jgi:ribosome biogenesis protein NSA1
VKLIDLEKKEVIKKYGEQAKENKIIQIHKMNLSDIDFFLILRDSSLLLLDNELNEIA